jgi:hypothetical protein
VKLSSNSADASLPPTVTVAAGNSTATFTVTSKEVVSDVAVTLTARQGGRTKSTVLTIEAPLLQSVSVSPSSIVGGNAVSGTITLHHPAPNGGVILALSSDSPDASAPATITVPAGAKTNTFTITTLGLEIATRVTISASISGTIKTTSLTIQPAQMSGFIVSPNTVVGGSSATGTVYLNGSAPSDGATVTLTSSGVNASVPKTVKVPAGATSVSFTVTTRAVSNLGTVILTAKYRGEVQTAGITLQPA